MAFEKDKGVIPLKEITYFGLFVMRFFLFLLVLTSPLMADSLVVVRDVKVDVSAEDGIKAKDKALILAPEYALKALAAHLKTPLSAEALKSAGNYVRGLKIQSETISGKRYMATLSYEFKPSVQGVLGGADLGAIMAPISAGGGQTEVVTDEVKPADSETPLSPETQAVKTLVVALYRDGPKNSLWQEDNPLKKVFVEKGAAFKDYTFVFPYGDADDMADVGTSQMVAGDDEAFNRMATRYGAEQSWSIIATLVRDGTGQPAAYDVALRFIAKVPREPLMMHVPVAEASTLEALAARIDAEVQKQNNAVAEKVKQQEKIVMTALVNDISAWLKMKRLIGSIEGAALAGVSLKPGRVNFNITYGAEFDHLKAALEAKGIALVKNGAGYTVSMAPSQSKDVVGYDAR